MKGQLILALDVDDLRAARHFVRLFRGRIKIFKVGLPLFSAAGPAAVKMIAGAGAEVFLDLKLHDIPNTVASAVRQAVRLKVKMLTVHISGGPAMLEAAVQAAREESRLRRVRRPLLVGVTVLTSQNSPGSRIVALARTGINYGLDGVVCSVREAQAVRRGIARRFLVVTPGIRSAAAAKGRDDQKRTATLQEARRAGSDFVVVGRPLLRAADPLRAFEEMRSGDGRKRSAGKS